MKKVIVFGGGTGTSCLLSGLKLFPVEVTAVITVSDNGSSTGQLKKELDIPAVGDVGKVLLAMSNADEDFIDLLSYRFHKEGSSLDNHPVRNVLLAALIDLKGSLSEAARYMCELLKVKGTVLPLTEERVDLVGTGHRKGEYFYGQVEVSHNIRNITRLKYDHRVRIRSEIREKILESDLIIFSTGSLFTSVIPHLIVKEIVDAIAESKAPVMYVSNLVTQPGETDDFSVGDHLTAINQYLQKRKVDVVLANNGKIDPEISRKYLETEGKTIVKLDHENVSAQGAAVIEDDILCIEEGKIRHDALKTGFLIFSYLMNSHEYVI